MARGSELIALALRLVGVVELLAQVAGIVGVQHVVGVTMLNCPNNTILRSVGRDARSAARVRERCCTLRSGRGQKLGVRKLELQKSIADRAEVNTALGRGYELTMNSLPFPRRSRLRTDTAPSKIQGPVNKVCRGRHEGLDVGTKNFDFPVKEEVFPLTSPFIERSGEQ